MNPTLELILRIGGLVIAAGGMAVVFLAPRIVDRRGLADRKKLDPRLLTSLDDAHQAKVRRDAAILDVKLRGLLLGAPGFILILIAFR